VILERPTRKPTHRKLRCERTPPERQDPIFTNIFTGKHESNFYIKIENRFANNAPQEPKIKRLNAPNASVCELTAMVVMVDDLMVFWHGQNKKILEMLKAQGEQNTEMLKLLSKRETASSNNLVDMSAGSPRPCGA
jgi:hypothetical protein